MVTIACKEILKVVGVRMSILGGNLLCILEINWFNTLYFIGKQLVVNLSLNQKYLEDVCQYFELG